MPFPIFVRRRRRRASGTPIPRTVASALGLMLGAALSAEPIALETAIDRAVSAAQFTALETVNEEAATARRQAAASFPNPSVFFEYESLDRSGALERTRETTAGLSTPLDFIWKRGARIEAAELRGDIARLQLAQEHRRLVRDIAQIYIHYAARRQEIEQLETVLAALERVRQVAQASVSSGEAPAAELRRIDLALQQHRYEVAEVQAALFDLETRLSALTGDPDAEPMTSLGFRAPSFADESAARAAARDNRPDLQAAQAMARWLRAEAHTARREGWPEAALELGMKEDESGREGAYVGVTVELPVFAGNRAPARLARSEATRAEVALLQAHRNAEGEVAAALRRWNRLAESHAPAGSLATDGEETAENFLRASTASFVAGEASLLEQLDAVRAFLEASRSEVQFEESLRLAAVELAHATASALPLQSQASDSIEQ